MTSDAMFEVRSLAAGIRAFALTGILILGVFHVQLCFKIANFQRIFDEMLLGRPLPPMTTFVLANQSTLLLLSLFVPLVAVPVVLGVRDHRKALFVLSAILGVTFLQMQLVSAALFGPLASIVTAMTEPPP